MEKTPENDLPEYLCIDRFLSGFIEVQSLKTAFELGLIDLLIWGKDVAMIDMERSLVIETDGMHVLIELLVNNKVIRRRRNRAYLTEAFRTALRFRDLMEIKIEFANYIAPDVLDNFTYYIKDIDSFMERSRIFDLFSYSRCYEPTDENMSATKRWMRYTTVFTRYEAPVCFKHFDVGAYQSMLDIGGNSGEFALQVCRINSKMSATVLDLPVVCVAGREYVSGQVGADRLSFHEADALTDDIPGNFDLISFKSMLHDWPDEAAVILLSKAAAVLSVNGTILVYERVRPASFEPVPGFGTLPVFLFIRFYRRPEFYRTVLEKMGFNNIEIKIIQLDMPFMLLSAKKQ